MTIKISKVYTLKPANKIMDYCKINTFNNHVDLQTFDILRVIRVS